MCLVSALSNKHKEVTFERHRCFKEMKTLYVETKGLVLINFSKNFCQILEEEKWIKWMYLNRISSFHKKIYNFVLELFKFKFLNCRKLICVMQNSVLFIKLLLLFIKFKKINIFLNPDLLRIKNT